MVKAVVFDLDGVIVSTDEYHYQSWKKLADEESIYFDREINHRLRGVDRMESLEVLCEKSRKYSEEEKFTMAEKKNNYYRRLLRDLSPKDILPGVMNILEELKNRGIKIAIGSSSKNTPLILEKIGLANYFDAVADGNDIRNSKPHPEVFLLAAKRLGLESSECLVVEDASAGVDAAIAGNFKCLAIGAAQNHPDAHKFAEDMSLVATESLLN